MSCNFYPQGEIVRPCGFFIAEAKKGGEGMDKGTVKWFSNQKGYGFITAENGKEIFVHHSSINSEGYKTLQQGQAVEFEIVQSPKGEQAANVTAV